MWEGWVALLVFQHVARFTAVHRRFDVNKQTVLDFAVDTRVTNSADGPVHSFFLVEVFRVRTEDRHRSELNRHSEIDAHFANRISEITEVVLWIRSGVRDNNQVTTAQHH